MKIDMQMWCLIFSIVEIMIKFFDLNELVKKESFKTYFDLHFLSKYINKQNFYSY